MKGKKLLLIDGHGLAFRAFYALPELTAPDGTPTNAVVGFFNMFQKVIEDWKPDMTVAVFDAPGPTFRHEAYEEYKAGRKPTPPEFKVQTPIILELLDLMGVPVVMREGVEADDVLASVACTAAAKELETMILSSDKDILQVLRPGISVLRPGRGITSFKLMDEETFKEEYGFLPQSMTDYLALLGDGADNVPGVKGVGEKTAKSLLGEYGSLEDIYGRLEDLKPALRKKMDEGREQAFKSKELVELLCDTREDLESFLPKEPDVKAFVDRCMALGLQKLAEKINPGGEIPEGTSPISGQSSGGGGDIPPSTAVFLPRISGKYPVGLLLEGFSLLTARDEVEGKTEEEALAALGREPEAKILLSDYKETAACLGSSFLKPSKVLDFKTVHYLLHPDKGLHNFDGLFPESASMTPEEKGRFLALQYEKLAAEVADRPGLTKLLEEVDLPLVPVLVDMEKHGIGCSGEMLASLEEDLSSRLGGIEEEISDKGGEKINLNSPKQVAWLLFEKLGLPPGKTTKTGYSTDISVLEGLSALGSPFDEVPNLLIEFRELSKMLSGFVQPLGKAAQEGGGIIHSVFEPAVTGTGRLSSRDPNLQNLPSYGEWSARIKASLHPVGEGAVFVSADYSQIELRVLAHLSGDPRLIEAFAQKRDIHTETASWVFSTDPELVTGELRRVAKMINFGLLYGMSSFGLAQRLGIGRPEASDIINRYFGALPGVKEYLEKSYADAKSRGYATTLAGRIRPLDEVSVSPRDRDALRRVAVNTPIQGTAADIARKAMVNFAAAFPPSGAVRLVLQVHDSLVCQCPAGEAEEVKKTLEELMEGAAVLAVPLKVESKIGQNLSEV